MSNIQISNVDQLQISCNGYDLFCCFLCVFFTVLEEGGVKMKLTIVDTPGFGDQINNDSWWVFQLLDL